MPKKRTNNYLNRDFKKDRSDDSLSKQERSKRMSLIRSKDTKFEKYFIDALRRTIRKRFKTHVRSLRGCPDIVFERAKICVFLDSDFWHGWQYPRWKHLLKNDFWREKINKNRQRDKRTTRYLKRKGWAVLRFWEHDLKDPQKMRNAIEKTVALLNPKR